MMFVDAGGGVRGFYFVGEPATEEELCVQYTFHIGI